MQQRVVAKGDQGGEEFHEDSGVDAMNVLPYRVRNTTWARVRGGGGLAQGVFYFIGGKGVGRGISCQAALWGTGVFWREEVVQEGLVD